MTLRILLAAILTMLIGSVALARDTYVFGPAPDWARYRQLGETALRARLDTPDAYAIEWPNGYMAGGWRHKGRFMGYLSCGVIRASAPAPGRRVLTNFAIVIDQDMVKTIDISDRYSNSLVNVICHDLVSRGVIPPAGMMDQPADLAVVPLGLTIRPTPDGAYIVAVAVGSAGATSGLRPGMVVTRVNDIALAGMGAAMAPLLGSDASALTLETAAGARIDITRPH